MLSKRDPPQPPCLCLTPGTVPVMGFHGWFHVKGKGYAISDIPEDTDIQGKIVKMYYNSAKRPRVKEATQECNKIERELNYCKQFLHLKNRCNDKIIGMHQYYTEVKTDNTSSSLISLRFTHLNEQTLGIWPRSGFQAKKTSGCGDQWLSAVHFASCRRRGG